VSIDAIPAGGRCEHAKPIRAWVRAATCNDRRVNRHPAPASAALIVLLIALAACSGDNAADDRATPTGAPAPTTSAPTASAPTPAAPSATGTGSAEARDELVALAGKAAKAAYDATYKFDAPLSGGSGTLRILADDPDFRLDLARAAQTARFYTVKAGSIACSVPTGGGTPTCLLVAKPGQPIPDAFDPGVQGLFTTAVEGVREKPEDFRVTSRPDAPAIGGVEGGRCFTVQRQSDLRTPTPGQAPVPGRGFESGDYCFDPATGVLLSAKLQSGSLSLTKLGPKPVAKEFVPPVTPTPLPSQSAAPSGSPTPTAS
jgi:hypothetical protein